MGPAEIVLAIAAVGIVMYRRYTGYVLQVRRLLVLPVVLTAFGLSSLGDLHRPATSTVALIVMSVAISVILGVLRGYTVHLADRDGIVWMRSRAVTLGLWVVNIAAKVGLAVVAHAAGIPGSAGTGLLAALGLGILAESLVVLARAARMGSTVLWTAQDRRTGAPTAFAVPFSEPFSEPERTAPRR